MEVWRRTCSHCFVVALVLQQHWLSNSKAIAYRQIFQLYKGKSIGFILIYYTIWPVLQVWSFFPFDLANDKLRMLSSIIVDAPFEKSSQVSPPFCWLVTTIEFLSGFILPFYWDSSGFSPPTLGFKRPWPSLSFSDVNLSFLTPPCHAARMPTTYLTLKPPSKIDPNWILWSLNDFTHFDPHS